jgi:glycosyltransferase involved in cell wall biosynthesis
MKSNADITAIVLTLNEEQNLAACLASIQDLVSSIIVVDSGSTDRTQAIAEEFHAQFLVHAFETHAKQFNWALDNVDIQTTWVLRIDADERLTPELNREIITTLRSELPNDLNGFVIRFKTIFMNRFLRHGGVYPFRKLLLFKYGKARVQDKVMDEHIELSHGYSKEFKEDGFHYDYKSLDYFVKKHTWYASKEMSEFLRSKGTETLGRKRKIYYALPPFLRARLYFIYRYYVRLGFLDGKEGRIFHTLQAYWYRFLVDALIHEKHTMKFEDVPLGKLK